MKREMVDTSPGLFRNDGYLYVSTCPACGSTYKGNGKLYPHPLYTPVLARDESGEVTFESMNAFVRAIQSYDGGPRVLAQCNSCWGTWELLENERTERHVDDFTEPSRRGTRVG